jgi:hypothetical protein
MSDSLLGTGSKSLVRKKRDEVCGYQNFKGRRVYQPGHLHMFNRTPATCTVKRLEEYMLKKYVKPKRCFKIYVIKIVK